MGRAVYSSTFISSPAVRTEPEPNVDIAVERWTSWNHFDPDSDEFFQDAEFEAFINPDEVLARQSEATPLITDRIAEMSDSSEGSDQESDTASLSDNRSGASSPTEWNSQDARSAAEAAAPVSEDRSTVVEGATRTTSTNVAAPSATAEVEPVLAYTGSRSPSPDISMPPTPPQTFPIFRRQVTPTRLFAPSPPAPVSPQFYSWPAPPAPVSPSFLPVSRDGPLSNARARMSYTRIDTTPVRVRISNPVM